MYTAERLLAGHVVHEDEAHGAPVVGGGDGPVALLAGGVLEHHKNIFISFFYSIFSSQNYFCFTESLSNIKIALNNSSYFFLITF